MKKKSVPILFEYPVDVDVYCTHSEQSPEEYGNWETANDISVSKVHEINESKNCHTDSALSTQHFMPGSEAYLVFITLNTGDSFGSETNSSSQCVHLFENLNLAMLCAQHIELDYTLTDYDFGTNTNSNTIEFLNDKLEYQTFNTSSYKGYFESLNHLWVMKVQIGKNYCETIYDSPNLTKFRGSAKENSKNAHKLEQLVLSYKTLIDRVKIGQEIPEKINVLPGKSLKI